MGVCRCLYELSEVELPEIPRFASFGGGEGSKRRE
jgi:hypothetical protein